MASVELTCPKCAHGFEISERDCPPLKDAISTAVDDAVYDVRAEFRGMFDVADAVDTLLLGELACAIRAGDRNEAERLLDRLAEDVGGDAQHQVSIGRYRKNPLLVAS